MGCRVILTPQSQTDLQEIVSFIRRDSPQRACAFGNLLLDKALSLTAFPLMGRIVPEINAPSVREIIHGFYRIIYEFIPDQPTIFILRFWHAGRGAPEIVRD